MTTESAPTASDPATTPPGIMPPAGTPTVPAPTGNRLTAAQRLVWGRKADLIEAVEVHESAAAYGGDLLAVARQSPLFLAVLARAMRIYSETSDPAKLTVLEQFIAGVAALVASGEPLPVEGWEMDSLLSALERLTVAHFKILFFADDPRAWFALKCKKLGTDDGIRKPFIDFIRLVAPELVEGVESGYLRSIESGLRSARLIVAGDFEKTEVDLFSRKTTDAGRLLIQFIAPALAPVPLPPPPRPLTHEELYQRNQAGLKRANDAALQKAESDRQRDERLRQEEADRIAQNEERERNRVAGFSKDSSDAINRLHPTFDLSE